MNPLNNRLKNAMQSVAVPQDLEARIRARIKEVPIAEDRLRAAVNNVEVPPFLEARIRARLLAESPERPWLRLPRLVSVATAVPMPIPQSRQSADAVTSRNALPLKGTPK